MATIRWRGKEKEYAHLCWCVGGVEQSMPLGAISPADAEKARRAKEVELDTGQPIFFASVPFAEFRDEYLEWHALLYPDSHLRVRGILKLEEGNTDDSAYACKKFESKALNQITNKDIDLWKAERQNRRYEYQGRLVRVSRGTVLKEFSALRALFSKAVTWKKIPESPFKEVKQPKQLNSKPPIWYRSAELALLYQGVNRAKAGGKLFPNSKPGSIINYGDVWQLMANTGLRRAEALNLQPENIDFDARVLHVLSQDDEDEEGEGGRTKSGLWREVPLNEKAAQAAQRLIARYGHTGYVLPRVTKEGLTRSFKRDATHYGLKGTLHSLRHTYGSHLLNTVTLRELKDLMGHAKIETTMIYSHINETDVKARARAANF
jgi:integrase